MQGLLRGRLAVLTLVAAGLFGSAACERVAPASAAPAALTKHRGMSYAHAPRRGGERGYGSPASRQSLQQLAAIGANWISITPFGYQSSPDSVSIRWGSRSRYSETDQRLEDVTKQAHDAGLKVMLKPHIWLRPPNWVGMVGQRSEVAWRAWFRNYREFLLHYAELAARADMDALCIGNELERTTWRADDWRRLIAEVRERFDGPLTYGAGRDEAERIEFWDALDYIGISAYYPLETADGPAGRDLKGSWAPYRARLEKLAARWRRPVLFTELGYRSAEGSVAAPWRVERAAPVDLDLQAAAYEAFFTEIWPEPWFAGVYWWKWFSYPEHGGPEDNDYTPSGKPAETVLRRFYRDAPAAEPATPPTAWPGSGGS